MPTLPPPCEEKCDKFPCLCVDAIDYATWKSGTRKLFENLPANTETYTRVINYELGSRTRYGYGTTIVDTKPDGKLILGDTFYFHIVFPEGDQDDIDEFQQAHTIWARSRGGRHDFVSKVLTLAAELPTCGTPYTPTCPPDPLLEGAMRYVRDLWAGPGASNAELTTAAKGVEGFLLAAINHELERRGITAPKVPSDLRGATRYLRNLSYQGALSAGRLPDAATLEFAGLEAERVLLAALEAEAQRLLKV